MRWMMIPSCPDYKVSDTGLVVRVVDGRFQRCTGRPLYSCANRQNGYLCVRVSESGKSKTEYVHHVVAESFIGPRPSGNSMRYVINHRDGNKQNNSPENLEYVTYSENRIHAARVLGQNIGTKSGVAKLTEAQVYEIRTMRPCEAVRKFSIHYQHALAIKHRRAWKQLA